MIYDVAISYAKEESARLEETQARLESEGLSVWTDRGLLRLGEDEQAERLVPAGVEHWEAIRDGIDHSATFVFLDSWRWQASGYCRKECRHALRRGIRTIAVGGPDSGEIGAAARVAEGDATALLAAVREGLEVSRAHARVRVAAAQGAPAGEIAPADVTTLAEANLGELGMFVPPPMAARMDEALARHRHRRRQLGALLAGMVAVAAILAVVGLVAWIAAQQDEERATAAARHVESLALATASQSSANTFAQLALARRAIDLEQNAATISALREAVETFEEGVSIRLDRDEPTALAVADDGDVALVQRSGAVTLISVHGGKGQREVSAEAADAEPLIAFAPGGRKLAVVGGEEEAAEVVDFETARLVEVAGTSDVAAVLFISDRRGIAVSHEGEVLEFDPQDPHPRATKVQSLLGPVRAAALASVGPDGTFALATLVDGAVEVSEVGRRAAPWRAALLHPQDPFSPGWETVRVCGDHLSVLATGRTSGLATGFGIPYTIDAEGKVAPTRSLLHATGSICLPEGSGLAIDPLQGQFPFPADGPTLPNLAPAQTGSFGSAAASSDNGQWAAVAGSDGTLKVVELASYGRTLPVREVETVAPADPGVPLAVAVGEARSVSLTGGGIRLVASGEGEAARGAYVDPKLGTVLAIGEEVLVVRDGRVRERIPVGVPVAWVHPGRFGASALVVPANTNHLFQVALDGGGKTAVELPGDVHPGATQLTDAIELPGRPPRLVTAATDGYLELLAYPSGRELRRRRIAPPGPISLAIGGDGRLLSGASDGVVRVLDPETLAEEGSRRVLSAGPSLITASPSGRFAAIFNGSGEAVVLTLPSLDSVARLGPIEALDSIAFDGDRALLLGADLHWIGGGGEASVTSWPLCGPCAGDPERLRELAAALAEPRPAGERPSFSPVRERETGPDEAGGASVTPTGVGALRLGMTAAAARARRLVGRVGPGCEFSPDQRIARLLPPLRGTAVFEGPEVQLQSITLTGGVTTSHGVGVGTSATEMLASYPQGEYEQPDPSSPFPFGFFRLERGGEVWLTMLVDPQSQRVTQIDLPNPAFCD